ncbi:MAG: nitrophenyl compound nitroreductase subunit ArsF family protein [Phycisphaerae bacterium]
MKRSTLNFVIDAMTLLVMLAMVGTGLLIRFVLPPGSGERRSLWEYTRHDWGDVHFWLALTLGALLLVHVALHWGWVCSVVLGWLPRRDASPRGKSAVRRNLAGAGLLILVAGVLGGFLWAAERNVIDRDSEGGRQQRRGQRAALMTSPALADDAPQTAGNLATAEAVAGDGIRVYYFHRTQRCHTCLMIEALARAAVLEHFAEGLAARRIVWQAINIEEPGSEHFESDFELQAQALVLTEFAQGQCVRWKNLAGVWDLVENESAFADYVRRELTDFGGG